MAAVYLTDEAAATYNVTKPSGRRRVGEKIAGVVIGEERLLRQARCYHVYVQSRCLSRITRGQQRQTPRVASRTRTRRMRCSGTSLSSRPSPIAAQTVTPLPSLPVTLTAQRLRVQTCVSSDNKVWRDGREESKPVRYVSNADEIRRSGHKSGTGSRPRSD